MNLKKTDRKRYQFLENAGLKAAFVILISAVLLGTIIYIVEANNNNGFHSIGDGIWWFFVTISTVGYGDKVPVTGLGRTIAIIVMLFGVAILSVITATISSIFVAKKLREGKGLQELKLNQHLLLCGWNQNCETILNILEKRPGNYQNVVLINQLPEETIEEILTRYNRLQLRFVRGDFTKETVLLRASAKTAAAAIIVPDLSNPVNKSGDDRTILTTLTLKALNSKIRVVVHILDPENYTHLSKARADEIIVSDAFTAPMIAHHITTPGIPRFWEQVLKEDSPVHLNQYPIPKEMVGQTFKELREFISQNQPMDILLGLVEISEPFDLNNLLSSDYSYLDEFIMKKFKEAGVGTKEEKTVRVELAPAEQTILTDSQYYLILERKEQ